MYEKLPIICLSLQKRRLIVIEDVDVFGPQGKGLDKILKTETLDSTYYIIVLRLLR